MRRRGEEIEGKILCRGDEVEEEMRSKRRRGDEVEGEILRKSEEETRPRGKFYAETMRSKRRGISKSLLIPGLKF
jgi:hypothetical protein